MYQRTLRPSGTHVCLIQRLQDQQARRGGTNKTAGLYLSANDTVDGKPRFVLFTDVVRSPLMAAFTAAHEVAGHHGLRALLGDRLNRVLELADQNPTVKAVADYGNYKFNSNLPDSLFAPAKAAKGPPKRKK